MARCAPRVLIVLALAGALAACGFQLRGAYGIDERLQPLYLDASGAFGRELADTLERGGVEVSAVRDDAAARLEITDTERERRVLALGDDGRVDEYELIYRAEWRLVAGADEDVAEPLIGATRDTARGSYIFRRGDRLAADAEEEVVEARIRGEVAERILRRLAAWLPDD